jgi:triosephosphate isomerase
MDLPVLIVNFKTYSEARGKNGIELAKIADRVSNEFSVSLAIAPQIVDAALIAQQVNIKVFSQHLDPNMPGSATGHIDAEALKDAGIHGTLLNHSERRLEIATLEEAVIRSKEQGLATLVCAGTIGLSQAVSAFQPWAVAMEPPELIGGDVSVTTKPQVVQDAVAAIYHGNPKTIPLTGAGVKNANHIGAAIELGTQGVLLASGVVKAKNPFQVLTDMAKVMVNY